MSDARAFAAAPMIATCAGIGGLRPGPGTWASLATLPFAWLIATLGGPLVLLAAVLALLVLGVWAVDHYVRETGREDPPEVVIDEVVGMGLALTATEPHWLPYLVAFALFRLLDIAKPWPIRLIDRQLKGGIGAMLDDVVAGVVAALAMLVLEPLL